MHMSSWLSRPDDDVCGVFFTTRVLGNDLFAWRCREKVRKLDESGQRSVELQAAYAEDLNQGLLKVRTLY